MPSPNKSFCIPALPPPWMLNILSNIVINPVPPNSIFFIIFQNASRGIGILRIYFINRKGANMKMKGAIIPYRGDKIIIK